MDDNCLSLGGVAALVALSDIPQDVKITVQIKKYLRLSPRYAVSDGVHWVPVTLSLDISCGRRAKPLRIMHITRACYHKSSGIFVDGATIGGDSAPEHIIGDPKEVILELGPGEHFPIAGLHCGWEANSSCPPIKALVTYKSALDEESRHSSQPPFFMIHLLDETGEIRADANGGVAHELYDRFEEGKVYFIYNVRVAYSMRCFLYNLTHRFTLVLTRRTLVEECHETTDVPVLKFDFMPLHQIAQTRRGTICDVIGIIFYVGSLQVTNNRKTGEKLFKRVIIIADQSVQSAFAYLWASRAEEFHVPKGTVVAFRRVKVNDDPVQYLSVLSTSTIHIEPQIEEAVTIHRWRWATIWYIASEDRPAAMVVFTPPGLPD